MLTIALIDNYDLMRMGLHLTLSDHFKQVEMLEATSLVNYSLRFPNRKPNLVIMGINQATREECLETAGQLKSLFPDLPLIIYDDHEGMYLTVSYFKLGVSGYVLKQNSASEILLCVEAVLNGKQYLCPLLLESLLKNLALGSNGQIKSGGLTRRESEIAKYLSQGMKTSWIAKTLGRKPSTISTIKNNIFKKMKVDNVMDLKKMIQVDMA